MGLAKVILFKRHCKKRICSVIDCSDTFSDSTCSPYNVHINNDLLSFLSMTLYFDFAMRRGLQLQPSGLFDL